MGADLSRDELLILLIEECGEVIQAATKCLRFGYDRDQPDYGVNSEVLFLEIGDMLGIIDALPGRRKRINVEGIETRRRGKIAKVMRIKSMIENEAEPQPLAVYK